MKVKKQTSEEIVAGYKAVFQSVHGKEAHVGLLAGGWCKVNGVGGFRVKDLVEMGTRLMERKKTGYFD